MVSLTTAFLVAGIPGALGQNTAATPTASTNRPPAVAAPAVVPDPLESVNRAVWSANRALLVGVIKPTGKVYRTVVLSPFRQMIANFARNAGYPPRVLNHLLQGRWAGARDESYRFLFNSAIGFGGLFDPASDSNIPKSDADFGQTLGRWGWKPSLYLMLPLLGPSSERDALGLAGDTAAQPVTYFTPYSYVPYGLEYNGLAESVDVNVRLIRSESDPYADVRLLSTYARDMKRVIMKPYGKPDESSLETLGVAGVQPRDPSFAERGRTRSVIIATTGRSLPFTYWIQPAPAPVAFILPGLGAHRLATATIALAEVAYDAGFSVAAVSSVFHPEFMRSASTAAVPSYVPVDSADLREACTAVDRWMRSRYPGRLGARAAMGYSMGAFHSLVMAATTAPNDGLIQFDRYVAIDTPVSLIHGIAKLDEFYEAPAVWPDSERADRIGDALVKFAGLSARGGAPGGVPPLGAAESQFIVGLSFRLGLRDVIFDSQRRFNLGVLTSPLKTSNRQAVYREIEAFSYLEYVRRFVTPYYKTRGVDLAEPGLLNRVSDLHAYEAGLADNARVRVILNRNDFLLDDEGREWLRKTVTPARFTEFEHGGHLGNLGRPEVQAAIATALSGLGQAARP